MFSLFFPHFYVTYLVVFCHRLILTKGWWFFWCAYFLNMNTVSINFPKTIEQLQKTMYLNIKFPSKIFSLYLFFCASELSARLILSNYIIFLKLNFIDLEIPPNLFPLKISYSLTVLWKYVRLLKVMIFSMGSLNSWLKI